jgi:arginine decarboxylase
VAYYSLLLFNVLDVSPFIAHEIPEELPEDAGELLHNLKYTYDMVAEKTIQECSNDALFYRNQARQLFKHKQLSLRERSKAESFVRNIQVKISETASKMEHIPEDVLEIQKQIYNVYYGNFSLFQSLPDVWAIDQVFPVMPIHRLDEVPERPAIISDITCDCDGKIDNFPDYSHEKKTIMLHDLKDDEDYYLGVFLVGAYQETLGDLHNLFGDTNVVSINVKANGSYQIIEELEGDSVADVLEFVEYDVKAMKNRLKQIAEESIEEGYIKTKDRKSILKAFEEGLRGYTYFEYEK